MYSVHHTSECHHAECLIKWIYNYTQINRLQILTQSQFNDDSFYFTNRNDDQSSCSSGALNAAISIELSRKCAQSVDSLLLKTGSNRDRSDSSGGGGGGRHHSNKVDQLRMDSICANLRGLHMSSGSASGVNDITPTSDIGTLKDGGESDSFGDKDPDPTKMPKRRKE